MPNYNVKWSRNKDIPIPDEVEWLDHVFKVISVGEIKEATLGGATCRTCDMVVEGRVSRVKWEREALEQGRVYVAERGGSGLGLSVVKPV